MFSHQEIINATSAENIGRVENVTGVSTDSRSICCGDLFVALKGPKYDGSDYIEQAVKSGAAAVMTDHETGADVPGYIVDDTLDAYQKLATYHRMRYDIQVIGITGTNGKTTVKEMIYAILSRVAAPLCSEANFNNHIGVPASLLKLKNKHSHAIIEMGMNHPGEIKSLSKIARPDVAVITNIGRGHLEFLGSVESVMKAKLEILEGLNEGGTIVLPYDSEFYAQMREAACLKGDINIVTFGIKDGADVFFDLKFTDYNKTEGVIVTPKGSIEVKLNMPGKHNCANAAAAVAAVLAVKPDISDENIAAAFEEMKPVNMRCEVKNINGVRIIVDCYNANPDSAAAALDLFAQATVKGRRIAVLGDMLELGEHAAQYHRKTGALAARYDIDMLIAVGNFQEELIAGARENNMQNGKCRGFDSVDEAAVYISKDIRQGDIILLKASRLAHLEGLIDKIRQKLGGSE